MKGLTPKCTITKCLMHTSAGFNGLCGVHYTAFKHRDAGKTDCICPSCRHVSKKPKPVETPIEKQENILKMRRTQSRNDRFRADLKRRATPAEKAVIAYLDSIKANYVFQKGFFKPWHIITDFYFHKQKTIFEVDGEYHNNLVEKDRRRDVEFRLERGFQTIRVTNEDVFSGRFKEVLTKILG